MKGNFLIITYDFYPLNSGGSHRPFKLARYLAENGWNVIVITANHENRRDISLEDELKKTSFQVIKVEPKKENFYTRISYGYYINVIDDLYKRWKEPLKEAISTISLSVDIDVVFVSCPPFSLSKIFFEKYFPRTAVKVLDMRDAWSYWNIFPYASRIHYNLTLKCEREALMAANLITVTSEVTAEDYLNLHPSIDSKRIFYMPNSFPKFLVKPDPLISGKINTKLRIGYVGSFYYHPNAENFSSKPWYKKNIRHWWQYVPIKEAWKYRSPYFLFSVIAALIERYPAYIDKIEVNLVGDTPDWLLEMIKSFHLNAVVKCHGRINKNMIPNFIQSQDMLLLTSSKREKRKDYSIAGKTFEYFSFLKPIIAFVAEGAQKDILQKSGIALTFNPDLKSESIEKFKAIIDTGWQLTPDYNHIESFLTKNVFDRFVSTLYSYINKARSSSK